VTAPVPALPTFTAGQVPTATNLAGITDNLFNLYNFTMGGFRKDRPVVVVGVSVENFELFNGSDRAIVWDERIVDTDSMWSGIDADKLIINTPGVYRFGLSVTLQPVTAPLGSTIGVRIATDGDIANFSAGVSYGTYDSGSGGGAVITTDSIIIGTSTYVQGWAIQDTGTVVACDPRFGGTRMWAVWEGPVP